MVPGIGKASNIPSHSVKFNCSVWEVRKQTDGAEALIQGHWQGTATEAIAKVSA